MEPEYNNAQQHQKLQSISKTYVPEWHFTAENPDAGSTLAILLDEMLSDSQKRYGEILHKHKIEYLNLFDKLKEEPIESAKSYVRFTTVTGIDIPVHIPKGTRLISEDEESGLRMTFETSTGITTTSAQLTSICATHKESDHVSCLFDIKNGAIENHCFTAFDFTSENQAQHKLLLCFDSIFDSMDTSIIGFKIETVSPDEKENTINLLCSSKVQYSLLEPEESEHVLEIDGKDAESGIIWLKLNDYEPKKVDFDSRLNYVLCVRAKELIHVEICGAELIFSNENVLADEITCGGITQDVKKFSPFGNPLEIYAECGIESRSIYARKGAFVKMNFNLDFQMIEQKLPEPEYDPELKIIMKKPAPQPKAVTVEIKPDYVLLEYYSKNGWKRLLPDENAAMLFNGSAKGEISLSFVCPEDIEDADTFTGGCRVRMRLLRADNLYRIPSRQYCPIITNLRFSYTYEGTHLLPRYACIHNNFETIEVTPQLVKKRNISMFYNREYEKPAMYFGFDSNPMGSPLSLYFEVENTEDIPLEFTMEYFCESGFIPMQVADNTGGLLYSGTMMFLVPPDAVPKKLFKDSLYWIRMIYHGGELLFESMPVIKGICSNMVRVENLRTRSETFFVDDVNTSVHIELDEKNLIFASVYINEEDNTHDEHWVKWEKRVYAAQRGRYYTIDLMAGTIEFDKNCFATYPFKESMPSIRVDYQSYQGSKANVESGAIHSMEESIKYISSVSNPMAAYGGYDGYNEETSTKIISNMLRTRGRAVSNRDYFDVISQVSYGVKQIKCVSGVNRLGEPAEDVITVALLIDEYEKGSHIFSSVKDTIRNKLLETSSIVPLGKTLVLSQPHFIKFSVRIWLKCKTMENVYDLQKQTNQDIQNFIDPLSGGFDGNGWEIGTLPTVRQLLAYLKMKRQGISVAHVVMAAQVGGKEYAVDDEMDSRINNPFAMAVNGFHTVYVEYTAK